MPIEFAARVTPEQYRVFLQQQNLPPERIEQVMRQIQVAPDGFVRAGPDDAALIPPAGFVPAGIAKPDQNKVTRVAGKAKDKLGELKTKINEKVNELARDAIRDQGFGASIVGVEAKVIPSEIDPNKVTIRTVIKLDSKELDLEFNGSKGKALPEGGYTVTVDLPYQYKTDAKDNIVDVAKQEYDRFKVELKGAIQAVGYNPERNADKLPPPGTTVTRHLLVGFKGNYALENLGINGEAVTQFTVQHKFGEQGQIQLSVNEDRLRKIGGQPHFAINDLKLNGGVTVQKHAARGVQLELDVIQPGADDNNRQSEKADRKLLADTVRFDDKGLPQFIDYKAAAGRSSAIRTARLAKQVDASAGAGYSFGAVGLSTGRDKLLLNVYESRHTRANRTQADENLATWMRAIEEPKGGQAIMGELRRADGVSGAIFTATARNDDATSLAASFGKTLGTSHVRLQLAASVGEQMRKANTIKRTLQVAPDGKTSTLTFDALDGKQFVTTLAFNAGLKVQASLEAKIREYTDDIVGQVEDSFSAGKWLANLELKEKVGEELYDLIKENVEKVALSFNASREHAAWGRVIFTASGIPAGATHDAVVAQMMRGDFTGAVAAGLPLSTNTIERKSFQAKVNFDFAGLLSYAMERGHGVIDEKKVWEFDGKKFKITELKGEATKNVKGLNKTAFQVNTYYVTSVGDDGKAIPGVPTQAITTVVYTSKEANVAHDQEANPLVGVATALNFETFVPFQPEQATGFGAAVLRVFRGIRTLKDGTIMIATATSTEGHVAALRRTPDEAQKMGEETARAILRIGDALTPELAAQTFNPCGKLEKSLEVAEFIDKYFWGVPDSFTGGFPVGAPGWNNRIDPDEIDKIRKKIGKYLDHPPQRTALEGENKAEIEAWNLARRNEVERIKALLPKGGVAALPDGFIMTAGASSILRDGLADPENEPSSARVTFERTYERKVADERFVAEMGQWARSVAENPKVAAMRERLARGEQPSDQEVHALLTDFMAMAAANTQGSSATFSDSKDLLSLARWTVLHVMADEENVLGMVRVDAELGDFAAGSSADLTPAKIDAKRTDLIKDVGAQKQNLDNQAHGS